MEIKRLLLWIIECIGELLIASVLWLSFAKSLPGNELV